MRRSNRLRRLIRLNIGCFQFNIEVTQIVNDLFIVVNKELLISELSLQILNVLVFGDGSKIDFVLVLKFQTSDFLLLALEQLFFVF